MDREFTLTIVLEQDQWLNENWAQLHQCLLMLLDSPINQAGFLELYIRLTGKDNRLIRLHKEVRIPRTYKRFEKLFENFLGGCDMPLVQTKDGPARLFQHVNKPMEKVLPDDCAKFKLLNLTSRVKPTTFFTQPVETCKRAAVVIVIEPVDFNFLGKGRETEYDMKFKIKNPEADTYSVSHYPITSSLTCVKITSAFERALDIF